MGLDQPEPTSMCPFNNYPPATISPLDGENWTAAARNLFFNSQQVGSFKSKFVDYNFHIPIKRMYVHLPTEHRVVFGFQKLFEGLRN